MKKNKQIFTALADDDGVALDQFVSARCELDQAAARALIARGSVFVGSRRERDGSAKLKMGQRLSIHGAGSPTEPAPAPPELVYRDQMIAVLDKPEGLPCQATRAGEEATVESFVAEHLGKEARLMHRLDRLTSGLLLVCLQSAHRRFFGDALGEHRIERSYLAIVVGDPPDARLCYRWPLSSDRGRAKVSSDPRAKEAVTRALVIARRGGRALLQIELETGRMHQIRAHLAHAGLPILGDPLYGGAFFERLALHAHRLLLPLPDGGELDCHCPLPSSLRGLI